MKFAVLAYSTLMALAFVGAIGAAYLNPRLLEPVAKKPPHFAPRSIGDPGR